VGNHTRCPRCNKYGNPEIDNFCRRCDLDIFADKLKTLSGGSVKLCMAAIGEVGGVEIADVKREDRGRVLNIIKRRRPAGRRTGLVQDAAPLESYVGASAVEPGLYATEKGVPSIEH